MHIQENISLKALNTFGINAKARYFAEFNSIEQAKELLNNTSTKLLKKLVLGGGSNILFTKDFDGFVLKNQIRGIEKISETNDAVFIKASAGEIWHEFVLYCIANNYGGVENLSLIPGNVGACPMQNIGAYGVEIKDVFFSLEALHIESGETHTFNAKECNFGYRESIFKNKVKDQYIITSVVFKLSKKPSINTSYGAIEKELENMKISSPTIKDVSNAVCAIRSSKLPDPKKIGNAGSFFKNPTISSDDFDRLQKKFPSIVGYPTTEKKVKVAAGWLIENTGWKGKKIGEAGVHQLQALVLVNYGNAEGKEIINLAEKIKQSVNQQFGIILETEVNIL